MDDKTKKRIITGVGAALAIAIPVIYYNRPAGGVTPPDGNGGDDGGGDGGNGGDGGGDGGGGGGQTGSEKYGYNSDLNMFSVKPLQVNIGETVTCHYCVTTKTDVKIDWGDGNSEIHNYDGNVCDDKTHTYSTAGTYTVTATGKSPQTAKVIVATSGGGGGGGTTATINSITAPSTAVVGQEITVQVTLSASSSQVITVNYGDGTGVKTMSGSGASRSDKHTFTKTGSRTIAADNGKGNSKATSITVSQAGTYKGNVTVLQVHKYPATQPPTVISSANSGEKVLIHFCVATGAPSNVLVDFGDGTTDVKSTSNGGICYDLEHTYTVTSTKTFTIKATGDATKSKTTPLTINASGGGNPQPNPPPGGVTGIVTKLEIIPSPTGTLGTTSTADVTTSQETIVKLNWGDGSAIETRTTKHQQVRFVAV